MERLARIESSLASISEKLAGRKRPRAVSFDTSDEEESDAEEEDEVDVPVMATSASEAEEEDGDASADAGKDWSRHVVLTADLHPAFVVCDNAQTVEFRLLVPCPPEASSTRRRSPRFSASSPTEQKFNLSTTTKFWCVVLFFPPFLTEKNPKLKKINKVQLGEATSCRRKKRPHAPSRARKRQGRVYFGSSARPCIHHCQQESVGGYEQAVVNLYARHGKRAVQNDGEKNRAS